MDIKVIPVRIPANTNIIFGMAHFIKTVEDIYEAIISTSGAVEFGIAFCEASQERLVRSDGNSEEMITLAEQAALEIACGHSFIIYLRQGFPINFLPQIKNVPEVCRIFCATANPVEIIVAETGQGRAVLGIVDGASPVGIENIGDKKARQKFLRDIGYKR